MGTPPKTACSCSAWSQQLCRPQTPRSWAPAGSGCWAAQASQPPGQAQFLWLPKAVLRGCVCLPGDASWSCCSLGLRLPDWRHQLELLRIHTCRARPQCGAGRCLHSSARLPCAGLAASCPSNIPSGPPQLPPCLRGPGAAWAAHHAGGCSGLSVPQVQVRCARWACVCLLCTVSPALRGCRLPAPDCRAGAASPAASAGCTSAIWSCCSAQSMTPWTGALPARG